MSIQYWNRAKAQEETEKVYGEKWIELGYGNPIGRAVIDHFFSKTFVSQGYGWLQSQSLSQKKIEPFIKNFEIDRSLYEPGPFQNFNEFFVRRFNPGKRPFVKDSSRLAAFAEARYLGFESVTSHQQFPVKGQFLSAQGFLGDHPLAESHAKQFQGGPLLIARLCPVDYHRFHFPCDGEIVASWRVPGVLHSVNPVALQKRPDLFIRNERQVTLLETPEFGKLAYIEIGALCVGKIIQTHPAALRGKGEFKRGEEKGYFLFGGSSVALLGELGRWKPSLDLIENTRDHQREVLVELGSEVAIKASS